MAKREYRKLGDICSSDLGKTLNQSTDTGTMQPYLCSINVLWDRVSLDIVKQARFEEIEKERYSVEKGDLLICEGGDIGRAAIWDFEKPMLYQNALHRVRFNEGFVARFYMYYLKFLKETGELDNKYGKGVTIKHLVKSSLLSIPVPVPSLPEQERIVAELDLLSGIIEKQKAQLRSLDTLAQSIFYDMFGDPEINEKRWPLKKIGEIASILDSKRKPITKSDRKPGIYPYYGATGIQDHVESYIFDGRYMLLGEDGAKWGAGDKSAYIIEGRSWVNNHAHILQIKDAYDVFVMYFLNISNLQQYITGAIVPKLTQAAMVEIPIIFPPLELQMSYAEKVNAIEIRKSIIEKSIKDSEILLKNSMDKYFG